MILVVVAALVGVLAVVDAGMLVAGLDELTCDDWRWGWGRGWDRDWR